MKGTLLRQPGWELETVSWLYRLKAFSPPTETETPRFRFAYQARILKVKMRTFMAPRRFFGPKRTFPSRQTRFRAFEDCDRAFERANARLQAQNAHFKSRAAV